MNTAPPSAPNRPRRRPAQARRDRRNALIVGILTTAIVVLVVVLAVSVSSRRAHYTIPEKTTLPDSVRYMGYDVNFYPDLPANELDPEAFSTDENGLLTYDHEPKFDCDVIRKINEGIPFFNGRIN